MAENHHHHKLQNAPSSFLFRHGDPGDPCHVWALPELFPCGGLASWGVCALAHLFTQRSVGAWTTCQALLCGHPAVNGKDGSNRQEPLPSIEPVLAGEGIKGNRESIRC